MKKFTITLLLFVLLCSTVSAMSDGYWMEGGDWWHIDDDGNWNNLFTDTAPPQWSSYMYIHNFPTSVICDVSCLSPQYNGTPVGCLGYAYNKGGNLRAHPSIRDQRLSFDRKHPSLEGSNIIRRLYTSDIVYVYFSFYDDGIQWYYASCPDGTCGFLYAKSFLLIPY